MNTVRKHLSRIQGGHISNEDLLGALEKTAKQAYRAGQIIQRIRAFVESLNLSGAPAAPAGAAGPCPDAQLAGDPKGLISAGRRLTICEQLVSLSLGSTCPGAG